MGGRTKGSGKRVNHPELTRAVAEAAGITMDTARDRLFRYERGHIDCDKLFMPRNEAIYRRPRSPEVEAVMAATGLTRRGALDRIHRVRKGLLPPECLTLNTKAMTARTRTKNMGDWDFSDLAPRRSIGSIPGGTAWERRVIGP